MKKILFVINHMNIGGIQKALVELLKSIDGKYDIYLLSIRSDGILMNDIPSSVHILKASNTLLATELAKEEARQLSWSAYWIRIFAALWSKLVNRKLPAYLITKYLQKSFGKFDVAISYTQPIGCKKLFNLSNEVVLNSCQAQKKISFIHCDFANYGGNDAVNREIYKKMDMIAAVSESVGKCLIEQIPEVEGKVVTVRNCCDSNHIISLANEETVFYKEKYPIVTVARLSEEKGLIRCVSMIVKMKAEGFDVKWHIIGSGPEEQKIKNEIAKCKAEGCVILHGEQKNPYRYLKNAKLFLLPSYHEAAPMVFDEARCLGIPILSTETTSAIEMVEKQGAGWVCKTDDNSLLQQLKSVLQDLDTFSIALQDNIQDNIPLHQFVSMIEQ